VRYSWKFSTAPILLLAGAGLLTLDRVDAEAKTSILYCGSPTNCTGHPYRPHGGYGVVKSVCAKNKPCFVSPDCKGEEFCQSLEPPRAR
jgi:hypothetical protein